MVVKRDKYALTYKNAQVDPMASGSWGSGMVNKRKGQPYVGESFITVSSRTGDVNLVKISRIEGTGNNKTIHYKFQDRLNPFTKKPDTGRCNLDHWNRMKELEEMLNKE